MRYKAADAKNVLDLLVGVRGLEKEGSESEKKSLDAIALLSLPKHLRKTALAIHKTERATASAIAEETGREEDIEIRCLEELVEMGFLSKEKLEGRVYYSISK